MTQQVQQHSRSVHIDCDGPSGPRNERITPRHGATRSSASESVHRYMPSQALLWRDGPSRCEYVKWTVLTRVCRALTRRITLYRGAELVEGSRDNDLFLVVLAMPIGHG